MMKDGTAVKASLILVPFAILGSVIFTLEPEPGIEALIDPESRLVAYHQLWAKKESSNKHDFYKPLLKRRNFRATHREIRLLEIPQPGTPDEPLYLTLRDRELAFGGYPTSPWSSWESARDYSNWKSWFAKPNNIVSTPPLSKPTAVPISERYVVSLHASDGKLLDEEKPRPFTGNNVTEIGEVIYDINQDGWTERVTSHNIGFSDSKVKGTLVTIRKIDRETKLLFSVLINVENSESDPTITDEWSYQCVDTDADGTIELQIGPGKINEIEPVTSFYWNAVNRAFESSDGPVGPHYRIIQGGPEWMEMWDDLQKLLDAGRMKYPLDEP